jgi:hypothetical protein
MWTKKARYQAMPLYDLPGLIGFICEKMHKIICVTSAFYHDIWMLFVTMRSIPNPR